MNGHIQPWMEAYLDEELPAGQRRQVDAHLANCPECRAELDQRRALSSLLHSTPAAPQGKSAERFAAEVGLQMQRRPVSAQARSTWLGAAWNAVPLALLAGLVFIEAATLLSTVLMVIPSVSVTLESSLASSSMFASWLRLPAPLNDLVGLLGFLAPFRWNWITALVAPVAIGLLYLSWLAGWWVMQHHNRADY
jgi:anti-sigma factor RsiW